MKSMKLWVVLLLVGASFVAAGPAAALSNAFFFGDSLSDTGNLCQYANTLNSAYAPGRCSNGDIWVDDFANAEGIPSAAVASSAGGHNFAVGGNVTADLATQISRFSSTFGTADPNALYSIWLGGNDVLALPDPSSSAMADAVQNIVNGIDTLMGLGAKRFLVPNLPDVGRAWGEEPSSLGVGSPFTVAQRDQATQLTLDFNSLLAQALGSISGATIYQFDVYSLTEQPFLDPAAFGVSPNAIATTPGGKAYGVPCLEDPTCSADPQGSIADQFLLFDAVHPTAAAHARIAQGALALVPEPSSGTLVAAGMLMLALYGRRRRGEPIQARS